MIDIMKVLNAESISQYIENLPPVYTVGAALFPNKRQMGLDISMIKGSKNKPIVLRASQFDVSVKVRSLRAEVAEETKQMPFFKDSVVIKEKDRQNLLMAMSASNENWRNLILDNIYGDISGLVDGADVQTERMRMQLLSQGSINISADDADIVLDYGMANENKTALEGTALWSDHINSNPVTDIEAWQTVISTATGIKPTRAICSRVIFNHIKANANIRLDIDPNGKAIVTESVLKAYLKEKLDLSVEIIEGTFYAEDGVTELTYYPDTKFTLLPEGQLGSTYYGTTPEEADLITGNTANVKVVRSGIAITTIKKADPVTIQTKVSQVCLPSFEKIDQVFIATVAA